MLSTGVYLLCVMWLLTSCPAASALIRDSSPARTVAQTIRASWRAFSPGHVWHAPCTPNICKHTSTVNMTSFTRLGQFQVFKLDDNRSYCLNQQFPTFLLPKDKMMNMFFPCLLMCVFVALAEMFPEPLSWFQKNLQKVSPESITNFWSWLSITWLSKPANFVKHTNDWSSV